MIVTKKTLKKKGNLSQLMIPLIAFGLLIIFNLIRDPGFFSIETKLNNAGNTVLAGNLISIINGASELAILAMFCSSGSRKPRRPRYACTTWP